MVSSSVLLAGSALPFALPYAAWILVWQEGAIRLGASWPRWAHLRRAGLAGRAPTSPQRRPGSG